MNNISRCENYVKFKISVPINEVLLEHHHFLKFAYCLWLLFATLAALRGCHREHAWHTHFALLFGALHVAVTVINQQHFQCCIFYHATHLFFITGVVIMSKQEKRKVDFKYHSF